MTISLGLVITVWGNKLLEGLERFPVSPPPPPLLPKMCIKTIA